MDIFATKWNRRKIYKHCLSNMFWGCFSSKCKTILYIFVIWSAHSILSFCTLLTLQGYESYLFFTTGYTGMSNNGQLFFLDICTCTYLQHWTVYSTCKMNWRYSLFPFWSCLSTRMTGNEINWTWIAAKYVYKPSSQEKKAEEEASSNQAFH